tara:strand:+ start:4494 stop:4859 length:366 start_codon:yes stop_codon:yes gene_type:complete
MKIEIEELKDEIHVRVEVRPIHRKKFDVKVKLLTKDILKHLLEKEIKVGTCLKDPSMVTNKGSANQLSGEWIFEKPKKEIKIKRKSKKVEKVLDKLPESVIIEEEKKKLPTSYKTQFVTEE